MAEGVLTSTRQEGLTLRPYRAGDEEGIFELFRRAYGKERSLADWRWKFCENPAGQQIMLAVTEGGKVVGQYAGVPAWAAKGGRRFLLSQAVESMVDDRFRRGLKNPGLQVRLVRSFYEEYMGQDRGAMAYGFPIPVYCRMLVRTGVCTVLHRVVQLERELGPGDGIPRGRWASWRYTIERVPRYPRSVDELWRRCQDELPLAIIRDARYLNWRYADHPGGGYTLLLATDRWTGRAAGLAVLRLGVEGWPVACLMDWLVPGRHSDLAEALLDRCQAAVASSGLGRMEAWFPEYAPQFQFLKARGYTVAPTQYEIVVEPFHPDLPREWVQGHWHYTMGDADIY